jgi:purine/pyrimidine-nucleoside phosphorylase
MKHSEYFNGKVQSLELHTKRGRATAGVIEPGAYTFSAASEEHMLVIEGVLRVRLPGADWKDYAKGDAEFIVPRNSSFDVEAKADVAYLCYYL